MPGVITGDGNGGKCGWIGGLTKIGDTYALVYSRKPCILTMISGATSKSLVDEIGLVIFKLTAIMEFTDIKQFNLGSAKKNCYKSC